MRESALEELGVALRADTIRDRRHMLPMIRGIKPEDQILLTCARREFTDAHQQFVLEVCQQEEIDWDLLYWTARVHGVAPLIFVNLLRCLDGGIVITSKVMESFRFEFAQNLVTKQRLAVEIERVLAFFDREGLDVMLVKGAALDLLVYHPHPYTVSRDVDLIVRRREEDISEETLKGITDLLRHLPLEYDFYGHHDLDLNGVLPINFESIWDEANQIQFRGRPVFVMTPEDLLITACISSCRKRYFNLKALCDIAGIMSAYPEMNWEDVVGNTKLYRCENIVYAGLIVAEMTLGCELPAEVPDRLVDNPVRAAIIRYLSQRMSFSSLTSLYSGEKILNRRINLSLLLPYASYRWDQVWRKVKLVWHTRDGIKIFKK